MQSDTNEFATEFAAQRRNGHLTVSRLFHGSYEPKEATGLGPAPRAAWFLETAVSSQVQRIAEQCVHEARHRIARVQSLFGYPLLLDLLEMPGLHIRTIIPLVGATVQRMLTSVRNGEPFCHSIDAGEGGGALIIESESIWPQIDEILQSVVTEPVDPDLLLAQLGFEALQLCKIKKFPGAKSTPSHAVIVSSPCVPEEFYENVAMLMDAGLRH